MKREWGKSRFKIEHKGIPYLMEHKIIPVRKKADIPKGYRNNPIGLLFEYHNIGRPFDKYSQAGLLIGMCMDNRKHLRIPDNFAFIIRSGGANLRYSEFKVSYAIAIGGVGHIALIGHSNCGMVDLKSRKSGFVNGLVNKAGWTKEAAEKHFMESSSMYEIGDEIGFILSEAERMKVIYPRIAIAPLFYKIEDNMLYCIDY